MAFLISKVYKTIYLVQLIVIALIVIALVNYADQSNSQFLHI